MKEVDSIVQSFDIRDDEITIEKRADGKDFVLGQGSYGQASSVLVNSLLCPRCFG